MFGSLWTVSYNGSVGKSTVFILEYVLSLKSNYILPNYAAREDNFRGRHGLFFGDLVAGY